MDKLKQLQEKLAKAQEDLKKVFTQAGPDLDFSKVMAISGTDSEKCAAVRAMNDECAKLGKDIEDHRSMLKMREDLEHEQKAATVSHPGTDGYGEVKEAKPMRFGDAFVKSGFHLKENRGKDLPMPDGVNLKTLMETGAGWAPQNLRIDRIIYDEQRPVQVIDLIPPEQTSQAAVVFMEETTFTNNAAEASEGATYGEAALVLTQQTSNVRKIGVFLPVTDEQLEDIPQIQSYLNNRLPFMVMQRLDNQIVNGSGVAPNLGGILNNASIQTHVQSGTPGDLITDALYRAGRKVRVTGRAMPNGVIIHPNDWETIRLLKTNDGVYIWGHPAEVGPERIWGFRVAQADSIAALTAIVGDFSYCGLAEKKGVEVKVGYNTSDFVKGQQSIRADIRVAFPIYRPTAFCKVTLSA